MLKEQISSFPVENNLEMISNMKSKKKMTTYIQANSNIKKVHK